MASLLAEEQTTASGAKVSAPAKPVSKKKLMGGVAGTVAALVAVYFGYQSFFYVSTDNAMVQAQTTLLSPKVSGIIVKAAVDENEKVKAGQLLVEIRPDDYQAAVRPARGRARFA